MQANARLVIDGQTVSTRGIVQNGQLYVPAADVAKALGKTYAFNAGSRTGTITTPGGANQRDGASGMVGEWITSPITRLKVDAGLTQEGRFHWQSFEIRNAEKSAKIFRFGFATTEYVLYDKDGNSVKGKSVGSDVYSVTIQPAAMKTVRVRYELPAGFEAVRAVYTITTQVSGSPSKREVFRISMAIPDEAAWR